MDPFKDGSKVLLKAGEMVGDWACMLTAVIQSPIRGQALWGWQEHLQARLNITSVSLFLVA